MGLSAGGFAVETVEVPDRKFTNLRQAETLFIECLADGVEVFGGIDLDGGSGEQGSDLGEHGWSFRWSVERCGMAVRSAVARSVGLVMALIE
jgi:hypothetical protein